MILTKELDLTPFLEKLKRHEKYKMFFSKPYDSVSSILDPIKGVRTAHYNNIPIYTYIVTVACNSIYLTSSNTNAYTNINNSYTYSNSAGRSLTFSNR